MTWDHRVKIVASIRRAMGDESFTQKHEDLLQFSIIEYLANVISDFCPVEDTMLSRNSQVRFSINQICEQFRSSAAPLILGGEMWSDLNRLAAAQLPSLYRQLKTGIVKFNRSTQPASRPTAWWRTLSDCYEQILDLHYIPTVSCSIAQLKILSPSMSFQELQILESFWSSVSLSLLPKQAIERQQLALAKSGSCEVYQKSLIHFHACLPCAVRSKTGVFTQKFALNCSTQYTQCSSCSRSVIGINMLGRVLTIRKVSYYLCTGCLRPSVWTGNIDHCEACVDQPTPIRLDTCAVCNKKAVEQVRKAIDLESMRIVVTPLCYHHAKHCVLSSRTVYDVTSLTRELLSKQ